MYVLKTYTIATLLFLLFSSAYSQSAVITGVVEDQFGSLPGANVKIEGTSISTSTDVNGFFSLELKPGEYDVSSSFVMYAPSFQTVRLGTQDSVHLTYLLKSGLTVEEEVSVGTRSKSRKVFETTVPVDVIPLQTIRNGAQVELGQILQYAAASFHSTHQTIADGTDHIDPATLRGLGPDQVLVLINGKRRHTSSLLNVNVTVGRGSVGTDFNTIPYAAIERVEILRDGAAAQYGSDAIAGVVNIVLKKQTGVTQVDGYMGTNTEGDGEMVYYNANMGFDIADGGFTNITLEFRDRGATNRSGAYDGAVYLNDNIEADLESIESRDFFSQTGYTGKRVMEVGHAAARNLSFFFNSEMPLSNKISLYAHGGRNFRNGSAAGFYRFPKDSSRTVHSLYPDGFSPRILTDIVDGSLSTGLKGEKNDWFLDVSYTNGLNELDFNIINSNNASMGAASPTEFYSGGFTYTQNTMNFDISRTMPWLKGVHVAFGTEMRIERFEIKAGDDSSWENTGDSLLVGGRYISLEPGAQVFPGFKPENELSEFRTNNSWYIDFESKLSKQLLIGTAARYESYSDFGDQGTWKLSSRYKVKDWLSINAGSSTGFRAPSLHQVYFNSISTQASNDQLVEVATLSNERAVSTFGIETLKPELSNHLSAGITSILSPNLSISASYYSIKIEDRIILSGSFDEGFEDILAPLNVDKAQFFTNAVNTKTQGIDVNINYIIDFEGAELTNSLMANFTMTDVTDEIKATGKLIGEEDQLFDRAEIARLEEAQPEYKLILRSFLKKNRYSVSLNNTLFGSVTYIHAGDEDPNNWVLNELSGEVESRDQTFRPKLVTDLSYTYEFTEQIKLTIGGHNVLNVYPDRHTHSANIEDGRFIYSRRVQQFGVKGAHYFVRFSLNF